MDWLVVLLFAVWGALVALGQFPRLTRYVGSRATLGLVPNFQFFTAPVIGTDLDLAVREVWGEARFGPWEAVPVQERRPALAFVWHPGRRRSKLFLDLAMQLVQLRLAGRREAAPSVAGHKVLARWAARHVEAGRRFQFAVRMADPLGPGPPKILFLSETCQA